MVNMKGISLSLNAVVIIGIAVLVIAAMGLFFLSGSGSTISDAEAKRIFYSGCTQYCKADLYETFQGAYTAAYTNPQFIAACVKLGFGSQEFPNRCLENCPNCNLDVTGQDLNRGLDNINPLTSRG